MIINRCAGSQGKVRSITHAAIFSDKAVVCMNSIACIVVTCVASNRATVGPDTSSSIIPTCIMSDCITIASRNAIICIGVAGIATHCAATIAEIDPMTSIVVTVQSFKEGVVGTI